MDCGFNILLQPTSIHEIKDNSELQIFPNPSNHGILELRVTDNWIGSRFAISDINGKIILESEINNSLTHVDINGLSQGVYVLSINNCFRKWLKI